MKKTILALFLCVLAFAAALPAVAAEGDLITTSDYARLAFDNAFANRVAKPVILKADRAIHDPVSSLTLLAAIPATARYQGITVNVDTGVYFYDLTDCAVSATSPTAIEPNDGDGCWYLISGAADIWAALAATTATSGATLVGIYDTATYFTGTTVETALAELGLSRSKLALTTTGNGASLIGVFDTASYFTGTDVETVLAELGLSRSKLALTTENNGASLIGVYDVATYFAGTTVEAVLAEIGLELSTSMALIGTPVAGEVLISDAFGQAEGGTTLLSDLATTSAVNAKFTTVGSVPKIDLYADVGDVPADPGVDGYRVFLKGTGGGYTEGKVYTWDEDTNTYDAGVTLGNAEFASIKGAAGDAVDFILGGLTSADYVKLSDFATEDLVNARIMTSVDIASATAPADPGVDGYLVFMTATNGGLDVGKIYEWDDTGNVWNSGDALADGVVVAAKGATPDVIVGGTATTNFQMLSQKLNRTDIECKDITVALGSATPAATAADPDWVSAYYLSASPVSNADQVVASVTIAGDGAVTLVLAANSTAESVYRVCAILN